MDITYEMELGEWTQINRDLRHHGLPSVDLTDPNRANMESDLVLLSSESAKTLRQTLSTVLKDCDRRQELIQELIVTNNQLRDELQAQTTVSEKYEAKTRDLRTLLDESRTKIQELEETTVNTTFTLTEDEERLRNTKDAATAKCAQLTKKCDMYEREVERLQRKLRHLGLEDENRRKRQEEVLSQLRKKWATGGATNENTLTIIDWYEDQITRLKQETGSVNGDLDSSSGHHSNISKGSTHIEGATGHYKALIKSYERQLRDSKKKMKGLENDKELLKLEMQSRPELKDLRDSQTRMKKLERILKKHGLCPSHDSDHVQKRALLYSTQVEDLEFLPVSQCRSYLKDVCTELGASDLEGMSSALENLKRNKDALPHLEQFASAVLALVNKASSPQTKPAPHAIWCEKSMHRVIPTLEHWALQIEANKEMQQSIQHLSASLFPWKQLPHHDNPTTMQMIQLLDGLLEAEAESSTGRKTEQPAGRGGRRKEEPPREMLRGIVDHFQNLFDVPQVAGVYARMNDIYTKLGEVHNILKALRSLLGLDSDCKPSVIVDTVSRLCERHGPVGSTLNSDLESGDIESLLHRLEEHEQFFPVFQDLLQKLIETLNVRRIDQVLPSVKALKLLAGR